jgi:hypothetical protein
MKISYLTPKNGKKVYTHAKMKIQIKIMVLKKSTYWQKGYLFKG